MRKFIVILFSICSITSFNLNSEEYCNKRFLSIVRDAAGLNINSRAELILLGSQMRAQRFSFSEEAMLASALAILDDDPSIRREGINLARLVLENAPDESIRCGAEKIIVFGSNFSNQGAKVLSELVRKDPSKTKEGWSAIRSEVESSQMQLYLASNVLLVEELLRSHRKNGTRPSNQQLRDAGFIIYSHFLQEPAFRGSHSHNNSIHTMSALSELLKFESGKKIAERMVEQYINSDKRVFREAAEQLNSQLEKQLHMGDPAAQ